MKINRHPSAASSLYLVLLLLLALLVGPASGKKNIFQRLLTGLMADSGAFVDDAATGTVVYAANAGQQRWAASSSSSLSSCDRQLALATALVRANDMAVAGRRNENDKAQDPHHHQQQEEQHGGSFVGDDASTGTVLNHAHAAYRRRRAASSEDYYLAHTKKIVAELEEIIETTREEAAATIASLRAEIESSEQAKAKAKRSNNNNNNNQKQRKRSETNGSIHTQKLQEYEHTTEQQMLDKKAAIERSPEETNVESRNRKDLQAHRSYSCNTNTTQHATPAPTTDLEDVGSIATSEAAIHYRTIDNPVRDCSVLP
mmetsp:Transcript_15857/g.32904  ORF Transcript_15857/g.32904 Transcript_15857/m.32904 type:complete len:315 (-) Transcript_15857:120-1064(-)